MKLISVQLEEELLEQLRTYCNNNGCTLSAIIRLAIKKFLTEH